MKPHTVDEIGYFVQGVPHPEGVAFDSKGWLYTGGAQPDYNGTGPIYKISPDGQNVSTFADTGGRVLGLAFDRQDNLYACDSKLGCIFRIEPDGAVHLFADRVGDREIRLPNFLVFDGGGRLYLSDSGTATAGEQTGAIYRFAANGEGEVFLDNLVFANGLAIDPGGAALYVVETRDNRVLRIPILEDGAAGPLAIYVDDLKDGPDGLAFDAAGNLYITIIRPSHIVCFADSGERLVLVSDPMNERIHAPSNVAFGGHEKRELYIANLFGQHISHLVVDNPGLPLHNQR